MENFDQPQPEIYLIASVLSFTKIRQFLTAEELPPQFPTFLNTTSMERFFIHSRQLHI